jgi:SAM-dependent methyltransferase
MFADAEAYERFMGRWSRLVAAPLVDFARLPQRGRFLDVGSGTGALALTIANARPEAEIVGIDLSKEYVAYAGSKNGFPARARFEVGDAQRLTFPDAGFDAAVSLLVFNFIPDPKLALREVRRVVKPGGSISAAVWDYGAGMQMLRIFWDAAVAMDRDAEKLDEKHMPLCRSGELSALWREAGMQDVGEQSIEVTTSFASFADYWEPFLLGQGPAGAYVRRLDKAKADALRDQVRGRLAASGLIRLTARVWAVRGRR